MKKIEYISYIAGIAAALLTVSCGQTEPERPGVAASFEAMMDGEAFETKGTPVEDLDAFKARVELFTIWGFMDSGRITDFYDREVRLYGSRYYPIKDGNFEFLTLPKGLTRTNEMFYGLASDRTENTVSVLSATTSGVKFNYQAHAPYTDQEKDEFYHRDAEALGEVLAGILVSGGVNEDGIIPLDFYHPLASVRFRAGEGITKKITITSIAFNRVKTEGTCTFNRNAEKKIDISWASVGNPQNYLQTYDNELSPSTSLGEEINDSQSRKAWFIIPQTFGAGSSIDINYTMYGIEYTFSIPLEGVTYEANTAYWYTLTKGGVIFESNVNSWQSGVNQKNLYTEPGIYW